MDKKKSIYFASLAVISTYILSNYLNHINVLWSVVTAYVCFKNTFYLTFKKSLFRLVGTCLGGLFGIFFILNFNYNIVLLSFVVLIFGTITIYFNNMTTHGYSWIFFTVTFFSMSKSFLFNSNMNIYEYFWTKVLSVLLGMTVSCTIRFLIDIFLYKEKKFSKTRSIRFDNIFDNYFAPFNLNVFIYSLETGLALFLVSYFNFEGNQNFIFYTVISILFLTNIPYNQIVASKRKVFFKKFFIRISGTLFGGIIGFCLLYFLNLNNNLYFPILGFSILYAEYLQLDKTTEYFGLQVGLLFLVLLVPMPEEYLSFKKTFFRLNGLVLAVLGIFSSMIIINLLKLLLSHFYKKNRKS